VINTYQFWHIWVFPWQSVTVDSIYQISQSSELIPSPLLLLF